MPRYQRGFDTALAFATLSQNDPALAMWLEQLGPIPAAKQWRQPFDPVDALARAILYQQLSGKAAGTIVSRLEAALESTRLHADTLMRLDDQQLRACGVSGNKVRALRDLSAREIAGEIPSVQQMARMDEAAIVAALVPIRGIGRWTVEMLLMFRLGRADVLPVDDLGIRKGVQILEQREVLPTPKEVAQRGECWQPFRSYAAFYLWKIADTASQARTPVKRSQAR